MKYTLILTLLIVSILFHEQSTEFLIKNFGHEQGLGEVKVHGIYQDKDMFLWFATGTGLYQFNGHRFYHSSNDSLLKKDGFVLSVHPVTECFPYHLIFIFRAKTMKARQLILFFR